MGNELDIDDLCAGDTTAIAELERLRLGADRYETARLLNPNQWKDTCAFSVATGEPFDELIDKLKPFLRPNA